MYCQRPPEERKRYRLQPILVEPECTLEPKLSRIGPIETRKAKQRQANVFFLDEPIGVGFSQGEHGQVCFCFVVYRVDPHSIANGRTERQNDRGSSYRYSGIHPNRTWFLSSVEIKLIRL